jgi:hypothetical protein
MRAGEEDLFLLADGMDTRADHIEERYEDRQTTMDALPGQHRPRDIPSFPQPVPTEIGRGTERGVAQDM